MRQERREGLVFGRDAEHPFTASNVWRRADTAWKSAGLSTYMGHSSITVTYDRYGHLLPGNEDEAAARLDSYLAGLESLAASVGVPSFGSA
jgi:integrase